MKKFLSIIATMLCLVLTFGLVACSNNKDGENPPPSNYTRPADANIDDTFTPTSKILIAYFSKTNATKGVAEKIQELTAADIFEIERKDPYPDTYTPTTEVAQDEKNANARPALSVYLPDEAMAQYDRIILGFPIWWHTAPMAVLSFLNYYDMSGKTIYTFCTSGGSPITESTVDVRNNAKGATIVEGLKFNNGTDSKIVTWLKDNDLTGKSEQPGDIVPPVYVADIPEITVDPQPLTAPNGNVTESLTFEKNGNAYTVTGMSKNDTASTVVIPAEHDGLPVTVVGESAFAYSKHNADIQYVVIPDNITAIERNAFYNRSEMTNVYISADSKLATIGNNAFSGNGSLEFIYIPSGVSEIGDAAFNNCGAIDFAVSAKNEVYRSDNGHLIEKAKRTLIRGGQSSEVPNWITDIAPSAFRKAVEITSLTIPNSVTTIGNYFIADSVIVSIVYVGVEAQWNAIQKSASMWNYGNRDVELTFSPENNTPKVLVVYFTAEYGNTEKVAKYIHDKVGGDIIKIEAAQPYTSQELNYSIKNNRPEVEKAENARPEIAQSTYNAIDMSQYDTVFIGYPIWWWTAPMIIGTFLEHYDFTGYDIYPFTQSASMNTTHFTTSMEFVRASAALQGTPTVHDGLFAKVSSSSTIDAYLRTNGFIA